MENTAVAVHSYLRRPLGAILETPEWLLRLEKVTRAYIPKTVSGKWVRYQSIKVADTFVLYTYFSFNIL